MQYLENKFPLLEAIQNGNIKIIKMLLNDQNIDVNSIGGSENQPCCPLSYACRSCKKEIIILLLDHPKIDVNIIIRIGKNYLVSLILIILLSFLHAKVAILIF